MSHSYFVTSPTGEELMTVDEFLARALERWPGGRAVAPGALDLWQVADLDARELRFDGSALAVANASLDSFSEVAHWFRGLLPEGRELLLTDTSSGEILQPFTAATSTEEMRDVLDA